ncbi:protein rep [Lewinella sp. LCG006]|uniref:protein rep n=1 Tax=Lewinella sp. LCG006 TaxID=3231911 RepID=UPI0034609AB6
MYIDNPLLDTVETSETLSPMIWEEETVVIGLPDERGRPLKETAVLDRKIRTRYNRRRGYKTYLGVYENAIAREAALDYVRKRINPLTPIESECFSSYIRNIGLCCHTSCMREYSDSTIEYIASHTCKHKLCAVCNAQRCKKTRRLYRSFFEKNPDLLKSKTFLHLTLTVPHSSSGWKGKKWYGQDLIQLYNKLRQNRKWKRLVYGGEFGVEVTRNDNGFHIHIHSLVLVKKFDEKGNYIEQSRNKLHKIILLEWNRLTAGSSTKSSFTEDELEGIKKGNKLLTDSDLATLDPSGATFIGLDGLYVTSKEKSPGYQWCDRLQTHRKYINQQDGLDSVMSGIMECIKYHFEPMAMLENGEYDFELIIEMLPATKGKRFYGKFGAFYASSKNAHSDAKMLSFSHKSEAEELVDDLKETGREQVTHPETGEPTEKTDYRYFLVSMAKVFFDSDDDYRIKISPDHQVNYLYVNSCIEALAIMQELGGKSNSRSRTLDTRKALKKRIIQPKVINHSTKTICLN